ncbi:MAG: DUF1345 domain-containing protein [Pseudanabaena sp.]|nr:MAG: DUF1345 domain-containing protein [Pseudanabaena sp.]
MQKITISLSNFSKEPAGHDMNNVMNNPIYQFFWSQNTKQMAIRCSILGLFVWLPIYHWYSWQIAMVCTWIASLGTYLFAQGILIFSANGVRTQQRASQYKPKGWVPLTIAIVASLLGNVFLGGLLTEVGNRNSAEARMVIALSVIAALLSWIMLNVAFGKHYSRFYYSSLDDDDKPLPEGKIRKGFHFPGTEQPSYLDFMYVANTIALTYSISDVNTTSARIRGMILAHSLISFAFYSIVGAGVLNAIVTS